jgi:hypothetical protein
VAYTEIDVGDTEIETGVGGGLVVELVEPVKPVMPVEPDESAELATNLTVAVYAATPKLEATLVIV